MGARFPPEKPQRYDINRKLTHYPLLRFSSARSDAHGHLFASGYQEAGEVISAPSHCASAMTDFVLSDIVLRLQTSTGGILMVGALPPLGAIAARTELQAYGKQIPFVLISAEESVSAYINQPDGILVHERDIPGELSIAVRAAAAGERFRYRKSPFFRA